MLSADEAADIARKAGLSMADAVALRTLADDRASAERIAEKFRPEDERTLVRQLFGRSRPTDDVAAPPSDPGVVADEGTNPTTQPDPNDERTIVRRFFHPEAYP